MICDRLRTLLASARGATVPIVSPTPSPSPTPTPTPTPTAYQARAGFTQPYFGIYDVQPSDLATVGPSGYGFDTLVITTLQESNASSESAMVDAVFGAGMNLICWPGSQLSRLANDSRVPCFMPSIDEPDINGVEADSLATTTSDIAALHAASPKPVMLGLSGFYTALGYTRNRDLLKLQGDITAADLYPDLSYLGGGPALVPLWGKTQTETFSEACTGILTTANGAILKQLRRFKQTVTGAVVDQGVTGRSYGAWFALGDFDGSGSGVPDTPMGLRRQQFDALIGGARSFFYFPVGVSNPFQWLRIDTGLLAEAQRFKTFVSYLHNTLGILCKPAGGAYPYTVRYSVGGTTSGWNPNDANPTFPAPSVDDAGNPHLQAWFSGCAIVKGGTTYYLIANLDTANAHTLTDATWGISGATIAAGDLVCYQAGSQTDLLASLKGGGGGGTADYSVSTTSALVSTLTSIPTSGNKIIELAPGVYAPLVVSITAGGKTFTTPVIIRSQDPANPAIFRTTDASGLAAGFYSVGGMEFQDVTWKADNLSGANPFISPVVNIAKGDGQTVQCSNIRFVRCKPVGTQDPANNNGGWGVGYKNTGGSGIEIISNTVAAQSLGYLAHYFADGTTRCTNGKVMGNNLADLGVDFINLSGVNGIEIGWNDYQAGSHPYLDSAHRDASQGFTAFGADVNVGTGGDPDNRNWNIWEHDNCYFSNDPGHIAGTGDRGRIQMGFYADADFADQVMVNVKRERNLCIFPETYGLGLFNATGVVIDGDEVYQWDQAASQSVVVNAWIQLGSGGNPGTTLVGTIRNCKAPQFLSDNGTPPWQAGSAGCTITNGDASTTNTTAGTTISLSAGAAKRTAWLATRPSFS